MMQILFRTSASGMEGRKGAWQNVWQSVYTLRVLALADTLSLAGSERVSGVFVLLSWCLLACWALMVPGWCSRLVILVWYSKLVPV